MSTNGREPQAPPRVPLYRTIADTIIRDIRRGRHVEGERLPASRDLARGLEVNRATVHQALQNLKREGWVETNKGGGTRVARRSSAGPVLGPAPAWDRIASTLLSRILAEPPAAEPASVPYDLSRLAPDERDFPAAAFAALLADVARDGSLLAYGTEAGSAAGGSARMRERSVDAMRSHAGAGPRTGPALERRATRVPPPLFVSTQPSRFRIWRA